MIPTFQFSLKGRVARALLATSRNGQPRQSLGATTEKTLYLPSSDNSLNRTIPNDLSTERNHTETRFKYLQWAVQII